MNSDPPPHGDPTSSSGKEGAFQEPADSRSPDAEYTTVPEYEPLSVIGRGGYGEVWLARDLEGRHWALKVVRRSSFENDRPYEREYRGVLKFSEVSHLSECQLRVVKVGRRDEAGCFYYVMELADDASGMPAIQAETYQPHTLRSELRARRRIPAQEVTGLAWGLSAALETLHGKGLVHRDVKPGNIIFVGGRPKLADPGLITDADLSGTFAGTEGYIPPEGPGTYRADVFSLGMTLYEACTGLDRREFPALPENVSEFPDHAQLLQLVRIINRACQPDRRRRCQSAQEMRVALERLLHPRVEIGWRRLWIACGSLVAVSLASFVVWSGLRGEGQRENLGTGERPVDPASATPLVEPQEPKLTETNAPPEAASLVDSDPKEATDAPGVGSSSTTKEREPSEPGDPTRVKPVVRWITPPPSKSSRALYDHYVEDARGRLERAQSVLREHQVRRDKLGTQMIRARGKAKRESLQLLYNDEVLSVKKLEQEVDRLATVLHQKEQLRDRTSWNR